MREIKITCDGCGEDITEAGHRPQYRLILSQEKMPNNTGFEYAVMVYPPLKRSMHFCGLGCLSKWVSEDA